jgi:uncharacterized membrane protein YbaN (DUF454 family)
MFYAGLGWMAVALAFAGVVLPGLPTTVFVLVASFCFSRSSPRFDRWLRENRWLGPTLERFSAAGGLPPSAKRVALGAMWTAVIVSSAAFLVGRHWIAALATLMLGMVGTLAIVLAVRTVSERNGAAESAGKRTPRPAD